MKASKSSGSVGAKSPGRQSDTREQRIEAHRPHGEKGDYLKVTATLSPEVYKLLADEVLRRKLAKEPNAQLSAILRECVVAHLDKRHG